MTPKQALKVIVEDALYNPEAAGIALQAISKMIPKPLTQTKETLRCPSCKRHITNRNCIKRQIKYCVNCGQALDWDNVKVEEEPYEMIETTLTMELDSVKIVKK